MHRFGSLGFIVPLAEPDKERWWAGLDSQGWTRLGAAASMPWGRARPPPGRGADRGQTIAGQRGGRLVSTRFGHLLFLFEKKFEKPETTRGGGRAGAR